ncbi:MAG: FAD-dependent oxidoreductase [Planctomycetota bacterium]|jgi:heterodisulfide reductase subunit A|nr:FAD-dependent oxidoreductase [Planctomycetota bacterium]
MKQPDSPRIGVFVCECGKNIAATVDCDSVRDYAESLDGVVCAVKSKYTCSEPGQKEVQKWIKEEKLDRVVISACSPRLHETTFRNCVSQVGMNPYLMEMANIREHCSWVHQKDPEAATCKARDLMRSAVARAGFLEPQEEAEVEVTPAALVIGGGIAGIQAALDIADNGTQVYLVEKEPSIGGIMAQIDKTYPTMDCSI